MSTEMITHALRCTDYKIVFVDEVVNGNECGCVCLNCLKPLCAKNNPQNKMEHFFSHAKGYTDCGINEESVVHKLAKEILLEEKKITSAPYLNGEVNYNLSFDKVELECYDDVTGLRPDAKCTIEGKGFMWIEFKNTHEVDDEKEMIIRSEKINCVEIDLSSFIPKSIEEARTLRDRLREFLIKEKSYRKWIYCEKNERIKKENEERKKHSKELELKREEIRISNRNKEMIDAIKRANHLYIYLESKCDYSDNCKYVRDICKYTGKVKIDLKDDNFIGVDEVTGKSYDLILRYKNPDDNIYVLIGRENAKNCDKQRKIIMYYVGNKWDSLDDPFLSSKKSVFGVTLSRKSSIKRRDFVLVSLLEDGSIETKYFNCNDYPISEANNNKVVYYYWGGKSEFVLKSYLKLWFKKRGLKVNVCDRCNKGILGKCKISDLNTKLTCSDFVIYPQFENDFRNTSEVTEYLEKTLFGY